tara:strand:- start:4943 stop:5875 length:933 start_codon:yes stop_codon:yes gene_type:complete
MGYRPPKIALGPDHLCCFFDKEINTSGMDNKYASVINDFYAKLKLLEPGGSIDLNKSNEGIHLCNNTLYLLRGIVEKMVFRTVTEEVHFFKTVKSEPLGYLVYFSEIRSCELLMPRIGLGNQLNFLEKKINRINKFFHRNWDFVHYMEQGLNYLDVQYFTRSNQVFPLYSLPEACYLDPQFFTSHDMLWARIKGLNLFIGYLQERIKIVKAQKQKDLYMGRPKRTLAWNASKTALTELIYALHTVNAINDGDGNMKSIATVFETVFNVKLDNLYKTYTEIKARKGSRARFLEELVQRLNERMENDDDGLL